MTDDLDSGQSNGTPVSPNAGSSNGNGDSSGSFDARKLQSTIEALTRKLDEVDQRSKALQGDKDRGITKTKSEVDELKRKIAEIEKIKKTGLDDDGAIEEFSFREDVRAIKEQLSKLTSTQAPPAGNGANLAEETAKVFEEYKLDPNDPEAVSLLSLQGVDLVKAVSKLAIKRAQTPTSDSSEASAINGSPAKPAGVEALTKDYIKSMQAARGNKRLLSQIREDFKKKGVDIYNVDFT